MVMELAFSLSLRTWNSTGPSERFGRTEGAAAFCRVREVHLHKFMPIAAPQLNAAERFSAAVGIPEVLGPSAASGIREVLGLSPMVYSPEVLGPSAQGSSPQVADPSAAQGAIEMMKPSADMDRRDAPRLLAVVLGLSQTAGGGTEVGGTQRIDSSKMVGGTQVL